MGDETERLVAALLEVVAAVRAVARREGGRGRSGSAVVVGVYRKIPERDAGSHAERQADGVVLRRDTRADAEEEIAVRRSPLQIASPLAGDVLAVVRLLVLEHEDADDFGREPAVGGTEPKRRARA